MARTEKCDQLTPQPQAPGQRPRDPAAASRLACAAVSVAWALIAAAGSAYMFACSTQPVINPGDAPMWGPAWVQSIGFLAALVGLVWGGVLIVLLVLGVFHIRGAIHAAPGWVIAWTGVVVAGMVLEALYILGPGLLKSYPGHVGEVTVRPEYLRLAAGFLVAGAAMLGTLTGAGHTARRPG